VLTFLWNGFLFAVLCSPQYGNELLDSDASFFNYCIAIMAGVTLIALEEYWRKSRGVWFQNLKDIDHDAQDVEQIREEDTIHGPPKPETVV